MTCSSVRKAIIGVPLERAVVLPIAFVMPGPVVPMRGKLKLLVSKKHMLDIC